MHGINSAVGGQNNPTGRVETVNRAAELFNSIAWVMLDPARLWGLDFDREEEEVAGTADNVWRIEVGLESLSEWLAHARRAVAEAPTKDSRAYLIAIESLLDRITELRARAGRPITESDRPRGRVRGLIESVIDHERADEFGRFASELRAEAVLLQGAPGVTSGQAAGPTNGPGPRLQFSWNGRAVSFKGAALRHRLCVALWNEAAGVPHDERSEGDVLQHVYGEDASGHPEGKLKDIVKQVNHVFADAGFPLKVERTDSKLWLEVLSE